MGSVGCDPLPRYRPQHPPHQLAPARLPPGRPQQPHPPRPTHGLLRWVEIATEEPIDGDAAELGDPLQCVGPTATCRPSFWRTMSRLTRSRSPSVDRGLCYRSSSMKSGRSNRLLITLPTAGTNWLAVARHGSSPTPPTL